MPLVTVSTGTPPAAPTSHVGTATDLAPLRAALAAWDEHGRRAATMVARLDGWLDILDALPPADCARWVAGQATWLACRNGPLPDTFVMRRRWPWGASLRDWQGEGWREAVVCRGEWTRLSPDARREAAAEFGLSGEAFRAIWHRSWPSVAVRDLDRRARSLGVDKTSLLLWKPRGD